ncbi:tagaturonate epimerase family protein [Synoicihabitans lomoniglobus]|uniref:Tagaturonate epimerase family protein n=1 Tax=Synoicihabitans lomoniglobus TaxID=2909285 RepID=A0AAE9ZTY8_9BACT|nr:tagaturonate epimerase family protein [Opitutaceae bacterium LMO-M01]WED63251.1 tagaturonate epimerase family protein [Opitutaceae bacterium LMO-M01]
MSAINSFLVSHQLRIASNPCVSPDFCLDWPELQKLLLAGEALHVWAHSGFRTAAGAWKLRENLKTGDCAWVLSPAPGVTNGSTTLADGVVLPSGACAFPATWTNLLALKNLILEHDPAATIFPGTTANLGRSTLGVGARFTTLHWPAVEWTMARLGIGLTANQNSIPRELVYDVDAMLADDLDTVPFPFIGANVPEGHQGQSVEGMSHGAVLSKLKSGFHHHRIAWSFNADHQPIGGKFDSREDALVRGSLLASYITFDLSPELAKKAPASIDAIAPDLREQVRRRMAEVGITADDAAFEKLLGTVWPAMLKMKQRDELYRAARASAFTTPEGRAYLRELSIDELPGLTTPETTAIMLALCDAMDMPVNFVAPAFGFQKNIPYPNQTKLRKLITAQWNVCQKFGVSIGFHSGSGKSAENYRLMGEITGSQLEIKTSGRYTYEMGRALHASSDPADQALWRDWYAFTIELAVAGAFSDDATERDAARGFILANYDEPADAEGIFADEATCRSTLVALTPHPDRVFFFEYNFLYVLAADGKATKAALGDHSPAGYRQRARFYSISREARLGYARRVAEYLIFLAETTGLATAARCAEATSRLAGFTAYSDLLNDIAQTSE